MLLDTDGEHGASESRGKILQHASPLAVVQGGRRCKVEAELDPRIRGVDVLATGAGRPGELLDQLGLRYRQPPGHAGPGGYAQIIHRASLSPAAEPPPRGLTDEARLNRGTRNGLVGLQLTRVHGWDG